MKIGSDTTVRVMTLHLVWNQALRIGQYCKCGALNISEMIPYLVHRNRKKKDLLRQLDTPTQNNVLSRF